MNSYIVNYYIFRNNNFTKKNIFLVVWAITQLCLIFLPINTNARLLEGLNIPLSILATYGIFLLGDWLLKKLKNKLNITINNISQKSCRTPKGTQRNPRLGHTDLSISPKW